MTQTQDYLKFYSEKGWQSFPCKPRDKTPMVKWADEATTEINKLYGWLEQWSDMNIGIATGARSGIFVLDVDAGHDGFKSLEALESKYGKLPNTPVVLTGGGGRHYFFKHPNITIRNVQNSGKLGKGLDIRADGGYVIAAGSTHQNGKMYVWDKELAPSKTPLAPAPEWMLKLLSEVPTETKIQQSDTNFAIPNGGRNNTLTSLAGSMRRKGMSADAILSALKIENKQKCIPPLSDAEVEAIASSVTRYEPAVTFDNRDRLQTEWAFCTAMYNFPYNISDFTKINSRMFSDHQLSDWWGMVQGNIDVTQAAHEAGIIADLERFSDYDVSRVDGYANSIQRFAHLAGIERLSESLKHQAKNGNDAGIDKVINELIKLPPQSGFKPVNIAEIAEKVEAQIKERALNPVDVWGIHYPLAPRLSKYTGGKQKGELILFAGEPKKGKSWWAMQDALFTAIGDPKRGIPPTPVAYWCGEMPLEQLMRRFYALLGVNSKNMKTGNMTPNDWDNLADAKALILNSPLILDTTFGLQLHNVKPMLTHMKAEYGIEQFVLDYASKIRAPGKNEIEQSANVSDEVMNICKDLDLAGVLIASVNKEGMDDRGQTHMKSSIRGSGQQIHDADVIYQLTSFPEKHGMTYGIDIVDYPRCVALNISAGRELEGNLESGFIPFIRDTKTPQWKEVNPV